MKVCIKLAIIGRIKSLPRNTNNQYKNGLIKKPNIVNNYCQIQLNKQGQVKVFKIHRLVAQMFIPNPDGKPQVNHIDGNKQNNNVKNLEWVTPSENQIHSYNVLKTIPPMKNHFGKSHVASKHIFQFNKNNVFIKEWQSIIEASKTLKICACNITDCAKGNRKSAGGYVWKYTI